MGKRIDLTGQRFGRLVVQGFSHRDKHRHIFWNCLCDCGNTIAICTSTLLAGFTKSCGCVPSDYRLDLTGQRFGRLVVQNFSHKDKHRHIMWNCLCDCGNTIIASTDTLTSGGSRSCGCLRNEINASHLTTHGLSHTKLHYVWALMIQRVSNPNCTGYKNYGGRGISICDEWRNSFQTFYDWAMSHGYQEGLSIDRIDVNGNYCPENCRWATRKEQMNNMRKTIWIEYGGQRMTISQAAERYNIPRSMLEQRIRNAWTVQEAIELPPHTHRKKKK